MCWEGGEANWVVGGGGGGAHYMLNQAHIPLT